MGDPVQGVEDGAYMPLVVLCRSLGLVRIRMGSQVGFVRRGLGRFRPCGPRPPFVIGSCTVNVWFYVS